MISSLHLYQEKCSTLRIRWFSSILSSSNSFSESSQIPVRTWGKTPGKDFPILFSSNTTLKVLYSTVGKRFSYEQTHWFYLLLIYFSFLSPLSSVPLVLWPLFLQNVRHFFSPPWIPLTDFVFPSKFTKSCTISKIYLGFLNVSVKFTILFGKVGNATGSY